MIFSLYPANSSHHNVFVFFIVVFFGLLKCNFTQLGWSHQGGDIPLSEHVPLIIKNPDQIMPSKHER